MAPQEPPEAFRAKPNDVDHLERPNSSLLTDATRTMEDGGLARPSDQFLSRGLEEPAGT